MKKIIILCTIVALWITACGSTPTLSTQTNEGLSVATQLVVGTLKLEDTEQAVTADQANELLVMWQVYQDLISSDTAAQEEIDGLVEQIQETMTAEQMNSISAMNLTQQDVFALMQEQGVGMGQVRQSSSGGSSTQSGEGFAPPDGGMMGSPPDGGMAGGAPPDGGMGGVGLSSSTDQTQATGAGSGAGRNAGTSTALVDVLIQYLQQIASA